MYLNLNIILHRDTCQQTIIIIIIIILHGLVIT
jgi:hypothetical protein